jgi:drug/metabolite transporter (DMT)-like permease
MDLNWAQMRFGMFWDGLSGLHLQLISSLFGSAMGLLVKLASEHSMPAFEIVLIRSSVLLLACIIVVVKDGIDPFQSERKWLLLLRGALGFGGITCFYSAVSILPLADVAVLGFLAPVLVAIFAPIVLGEHPTAIVGLALPLCTLGVVLVAQPSFLLSQAVEAPPASGIAYGVMQVSQRASSCWLAGAGDAECACA